MVNCLSDRCYLNVMDATHNVDEEKRELHQMILIDITVEEISVWRRLYVSLGRANVAGIERRPIRVEHSVSGITSI